MPPAPLIIRPRFVLWTAFLRQLPLQLFLTLWASMFFGGMFAFFRAAVLLARPGAAIDGVTLASLFQGPALIGTLVFLGFPAAVIGARALNYRNTRYTIGDRFIDVEEGFFTTQRKRVAIADMREVSVRRGVLQRLSGVGSVYLATRTQGGGWGWRGSPMLGATSMVGSGVMLMDLAEWSAVYDELQRRLDARPDQAR